MCAKQVSDYPYDTDEMRLYPEKVVERLRQDGEVVWSNRLKHWLVLSMPAATEALKNPKLKVIGVFNHLRKAEQKMGLDFKALSSVCYWIPFLHDGDTHSRMRVLFARLLAEIRTEYLEAYEAASVSMLDEIREAGNVDFAADYAERIHNEAFGRMLGFSFDDRLFLNRTSRTEGVIDYWSNLSEMIKANQRQSERLLRLDELSQKPEVLDMLNRIGKQLKNAGIDDSPVNRLGCLNGLMMLGSDTLSGTLSLGLAHLLDAHGGSIKAKDWIDPGDMVDELIRLTTMVQFVFREADEPVELAGQQIEKGEAMIVFLQAANRDPEVFGCPHAIDITQGANIAFGASRHLCLGKALSRAAIEISLRGLSSLPAITAMKGRELDVTRITRKYKKLPVQIGFNDDD